MKKPVTSMLRHTYPKEGQVLNLIEVSPAYR